MIGENKMIVTILMIASILYMIVKMLPYIIDFYNMMYDDNE